MPSVENFRFLVLGELPQSRFDFYLGFILCDSPGYTDGYYSIMEIRDVAY